MNKYLRMQRKTEKDELARSKRMLEIAKARELNFKPILYAQSGRDKFWFKIADVYASKDVYVSCLKCGQRYRLSSRNWQLRHHDMCSKTYP